MNKKNKNATCDDNSYYTDGFPVNDNPDKRDEIESRDPARPFDSGRNKDHVSKKKNENHSGSTMNEPNKYKK